MKTATASIEIAASPELVRQKFLQFSDLPKYHPDGFFIEITPQHPDKRLAVGDKLKNHFAIGTFDATIAENSPERFTWAGGNSAIFLGEHTFFFEPSTKTPGGTTFTQSEKFTGAFSFLMGESVVSNLVGLQKKSQSGWERYNLDFKKWCEGA